MKIQPLSDRILLKAVKKDSVTTSGIYIPDWANKERPFIYEVIAVWPGRADREPITLNVWDKVLSGQYSWDDVKVDSEEYKIVWIEYILAKIEE